MSRPMFSPEEHAARLPGWKKWARERGVLVPPAFLYNYVPTAANSVTYVRTTNEQMDNLISKDPAARGIPECLSDDGRVWPLPVDHTERKVIVMDYRELLIKYMRCCIHCEGSTCIIGEDDPAVGWTSNADMGISAEEYAELNVLAEEAKKRSGK